MQSPDNLHGMQKCEGATTSLALQQSVSFTNAFIYVTSNATLAVSGHAISICNNSPWKFIDSYKETHKLDWAPGYEATGLCAPGKRSEQSAKWPQLNRLSTPAPEPTTSLRPPLATTTDSSSSSASGSLRARTCSIDVANGSSDVQSCMHDHGWLISQQVQRRGCAGLQPSDSNMAGHATPAPNCRRVAAPTPGPHV